jgi:hypothetical protein
MQFLNQYLSIIIIHLIELFIQANSDDIYLLWILKIAISVIINYYS